MNRNALIHDIYQIIKPYAASKDDAISAARKLAEFVEQVKAQREAGR